MVSSVDVAGAYVGMSGPVIATGIDPPLRGRRYAHLFCLFAAGGLVAMACATSADSLLYKLGLV